ncbi:hypothetical protein ACFSCZ_12505 [Siminovitchia sediminis]|uniref:Uncharacterized protein n=1 Tax=Siminovitchia sediminis TaxID=1274353 RepID=A0ABW4KMU0_9BACI
MKITVEQNGKQMDAVLGLIKEIRGETVVFSIIGKEVAVNAAGSTVNNLRKIIEENETALIPIHMETKSILLEAKVPENLLDELAGTGENQDQMLEERK